MLRTDALTWRIGAVPIVDGVTLELQSGEFLGVIGPNGAGKTSLFNLISGLCPATSGRVHLDGADITTLAPHQRARRGLGRTFQASSVFGSLSVGDNVRLAVQAKRSGNLRFWRRAEAYPQKVEEILGLVGLREDSKAGSLAHGEKRKLEIALLLAGDPKVLLLDEPMAGVSTEDVPGLMDVIRRVLAQGNRSILMVEHHMDIILELADRLAVMHHGALLACDTPAKVMANAEVQAAYLGETL